MAERGFEEIEDILEANANRTNHLLAIAIDDYLHCPKLHNAVKDVEDFAKLMTEKFEFEQKNIRILTNEKATKSNIFKTLEELAGTLTPNDNLVLYFSGHGEYNKILKQGFWIPIEAIKQDFSHYISNSTIKDYLSATKTHHTFLIADSCFSGSLFSRGTKDVAQRLEKNPSRWGLTSGQNEIVADGKPGKNSPFATSLLYHLRQATKPIGVQKLCDIVLETTAANAHQTPLGEPLQVEGHKSGQFVFRLKKDENSDWAKAEKINTKTAYQQFITLYPNGENVKIAKAKIHDFEEEATWEYTERLNSVSAYARYTQRFPKGKHLAAAAEKIKILEEDEIWQRALMYSTYSKYFGYLKLYPNGRYALFAQEAIDAILNIDDIWAETVSQNTLKSYEDFIEHYPDSKYVADAKQKVLLLSRAAEAENERKAQAEKERLAKAQAERERKEKPKTPPVYQTTTPTTTVWQNIPKQYKNIGITVVLLIFGIWGIFKINQEEELQPQFDTNVPIEDLMIKVEGGTFQMGSNESDDEKPIHSVTVPTFYISKCEVTQKQWQEIMGENPSKFKGCDDCPVEKVSWDDIQEFIKKLNQKTGQKYRLPSEAEWEFAARGGNQSENYKYAGSNNLDEVAWYRENSDDKTHPVGTKAANELGIYDMSGNVWEWCEDVWHDDYKNAPNDGSAWIDKAADKSLYRVPRGGSYFNLSDYCRSMSRSNDPPTSRYNGVGFRLGFQVQ
jgi:formylglycine-generating enzyme required for sulfatase activity